MGDWMRAGRFIALVAVLSAASAGLLRAQTVLDMRDVELRSFVEIVAEQTGRNYVIDPQVSGTVTVVAPDAVSPDAIYEIFRNVLELNRLTIVEGRDADRIVPTAGASELSGPGEDHTLRGSAYETRVIPITARDMDEVVEAIVPLVPADAAITPLRSQGLLVLSDRRDNIARIENLVRRLDGAGRREVEVIPLNDANAGDLLSVIEGLDVIPAGSNISADTSANTMVLSGPPEFRDRMRRLIRQMDSPQQAAVSRVVPLDFAESDVLAEVLTQSVGAAAGEDGTGEITIVAEPQSNAIVVNAPSDRIDTIVESIRQLDAQPDQVLIEAVVFEMASEKFSDLSVQFGGVLNDATGGGTSFSMEGRDSLLTLLSAAMAGLTPNPGDGGGIGAVSQGNFAGLLTAVAREQSTRLLSTPSVLALNNQDAEIVVAENVPFVTGSFSTVGDSAIPESPFETIERQDVGLTLNVRPQINRGGTVRMEISQEVSNLTGSTSAAGGEITARRSLETTVMVDDGRVILLGGLMEEDDTRRSDGVPVLRSVPLIGRLFEGTSAREGQRMLLLMLRPRVIRDHQEAADVARQVADGTQNLGRQIEARSSGNPNNPARPPAPFGGVDRELSFTSTRADAATRERNFPGLPPRLEFGADR